MKSFIRSLIIIGIMVAFLQVCIYISSAAQQHEAQKKVNSSSAILKTDPAKFASRDTGIDSLRDQQNKSCFPHWEKKKAARI